MGIGLVLLAGWLVDWLVVAVVGAFGPVSCTVSLALLLFTHGMAGDKMSGRYRKSGVHIDVHRYVIPAKRLVFFFNGLFV